MARCANRSLKMQEFRSNGINYSVTPATSVTSVFFFLYSLFAAILFL
ncbi:hypothetical protein [Richelia sinica]|nr:hypothetical protein [Richelia sinica]MBD2663518.1 hypothetical protein [Richelia sinica FACHB-800]